MTLVFQIALVDLAPIRLMATKRKPALPITIQKGCFLSDYSQKQPLLLVVF